MQQMKSVYRSDLNSMVSLVRCESFFTFAAVTYIWDTNVLPDFTTFLACCKSPTRENIPFCCIFHFKPCSNLVANVLQLVMWHAGLHTVCV